VGCEKRFQKEGGAKRLQSGKSVKRRFSDKWPELGFAAGNSPTGPGTVFAALLTTIA
jgi:hypothetical protein